MSIRLLHRGGLRQTEVHSTQAFNLHRFWILQSVLPIRHYSTSTNMSTTTTAMSTAPQPYSREGAKDNEFCIPSVNIAPFLKNPSSSDANTIVDQVRAACQSTGFFQITGHGISKKLQEEVFAAGKRFFDLPYEEKLKLDAKKQVGYRGYDVLASQAYSEGLKPDLKEVRILGHFYSFDLRHNNL
jgi:hypothetical protein